MMKLTVYSILIFTIVPLKQGNKCKEPPKLSCDLYLCFYSHINTPGFNQVLERHSVHIYIHILDVHQSVTHQFCTVVSIEHHSGKGATVTPAGDLVTSISRSYCSVSDQCGKICLNTHYLHRREQHYNIVHYTCSQPPILLL
ncbi:hypothetical protein XELAEV_18025220mg [Xenopus laevis]|uniref:Uncharacterized protein n=1 Tax=Xenopus laevis TaxID=8355 RepID=A0A974D1A6_XENLA|nr:hypothetical protein XELAEV_18025220mg [Xenopus laevis]